MGIKRRCPLMSRQGAEALCMEHECQAWPMEWSGSVYETEYKKPNNVIVKGKFRDLVGKCSHFPDGREMTYTALVDRYAGDGFPLPWIAFEEVILGQE